MKVRLLIFLLYSTLFFGCKKFVETPKETCFIPFVDFVAYNVNPSTLEVSFSSITSYNGTITSHHWDFGDGTSFDGEIPPPHKYPSQNPAGGGNSYRIKYTVTNDCGEAYWTDDIKINRCLADVKFTYRFLNDSTVEFTNTTSSSSPVSYAWDFGDSTKSSSSAAKFTKTYLYDGKYTVTLKATNACGTNFFIAAIPVCTSPVPAQKITVSGCAAVSIDASATKNGALYQWDFGNGTVLPATPSASPSISYTYPKSGSYNIKLSVINKNACDTVTLTSPVTVTIVNVTPNNAWSYSSDDLEFDFSRSAVVNATSYSWDFGDGTTASVQNPGKKIYDNPGTYTVTLIAGNGCSGDYRFSVPVNAPYFKTIGNVPSTGFQDVVAISALQIYYLGTNGKLYRTDTAGNWSSAINLPAALNFNNDTKLFKDLSNNIWIYGRNEVARFNPATATWTSSFVLTGYDRNTTINSITVDNAGNLWTAANREIRRNSTIISSGNNQFSSIAFAPSTGRIWATASNRSLLYYISSGSTQLNTVSSAGISGGADALRVGSNGELYFITASAVNRTNSSGTLLNSYSPSTTGGLLTGAILDFDLDAEGNLWALSEGRLIKIPLSASTSAKNYSYTQQLSNLSSVEVLGISTNDNDILVAKPTTGNAAIQIK